MSDIRMGEALQQTLLMASLPGGLGGLAWFLYGLKRGHFRNNRYTAKATIEILGGMLVASFISLGPQPTTAFVMGIVWSGVIQVIRTKVTKITEAVLGELK